jgi:hypothetical protein
MLRDSRRIAEAYATTSVPSTVGPSVIAGNDVPAVASIANEEPKKTVKDWIRLEPGLCPIDTVRKADHTAHTILQFIYSVCASPDAVNRVLKTINKAYKQDHK